MNDITVNGTVSDSIIVRGTNSVVTSSTVINAGLHSLVVQKSRNSIIQNVVTSGSKYNNIAIASSDDVTLDGARVGGVKSTGYSNILLSSASHSTIQSISILSGLKSAPYTIEESDNSDYNSIGISNQSGVTVKIIGPNTFLKTL